MPYFKAFVKLLTISSSAEKKEITAQNQASVLHVFSKSLIKTGAICGAKFDVYKKGTREF